MKALDTPVLLALLQGDPRARRAVRAGRGEELATTEANLLELTWIAARGPPAGRSARLATLGRLRHRITVLPLEDRAGEEVRRRASREVAGLSPLVAAMLCSLEVHGCDELVTDDPRQFVGKWRFRIVKLVK